MTLAEFSLAIILPALGIAVFLAGGRLARGPTLADRVVAIDLMTAIGIGIAAVYAIATDEPAILDIAVILGLISFLGTVAFARYLRKRN